MEASIFLQGIYTGQQSQSAHKISEPCHQAVTRCPVEEDRNHDQHLARGVTNHPTQCRLPATAVEQGLAGWPLPCNWGNARQKCRMTWMPPGPEPGKLASGWLVRTVVQRSGCYSIETDRVFGTCPVPRARSPRHGCGLQAACVPGDCIQGKRREEHMLKPVLVKSLPVNPALKNELSYRMEMSGEGGAGRGHRQRCGHEGHGPVV